MPQRQDYILRLLEELGRFLAEVLKFRRAGSHDAALLTILHAQERLFARPAAEFMTRPVGEQMHLLALGESGADAREKCLAYATLLAEAGHTYQAREQPALAEGAYQVALQVVRLALQDHPAGDSPEQRDRVLSLIAQLPGDGLKAEIQALLGPAGGNGKSPA
ncbi:MAG: hypothetical protein PHE83_00165 [Opitutaceae bacterium]|nr:hypothetical protein [Opitutaceae bacterium]